VGGTRFTRQRAELLALLDDVGGFRTPLQLYRDLRSRGAGVGLTTVYRNLQWLCDAGEIDAMRMPTGEQLFRRCGAAHHHHLVCRNCAAAAEVSSAAMERWAATTGFNNGFTDISHTLEIFGLCAHCSAHC
jgi:Fur family ferric uptake transcriptional regulator